VHKVSVNPSPKIHFTVKSGKATTHRMNHFHAVQVSSHHRSRRGTGQRYNTDCV